jgi:hypothetical protein
VRTSDARGLTQHHAVLTPDSKRAWLNGYLVLPAETDRPAATDGRPLAPRYVPSTLNPAGWLPLAGWLLAAPP